MNQKLLAMAILLSTLPARAIIIEDSADRLMFDLQWSVPNFIGMGFSLGPNADYTGPGGSELQILPNNGNPYSFIVEVHQRINDMPLPWWTFSVTFQGWNREGISHPPDPFWGTMTEPHVSIPFSNHPFTVVGVDGNDHAMRVIIGSLPSPVPDSGGTLLLLAGALGSLAWFGRRATA